MGTATAMTSKERWLAALRMQPVDRLPFWPKLDAAYPRWRTGRFAGKSNDALHDVIGSDKHVWIPHGLREVRTKTSTKSTRADDTRTTVYRTPHGEMREVYRFDEDSQAWHPIEFPVKTAQAIRLMTEMYADVEVEFDAKVLEEARAQVREIGGDAFTAGTVGTSPLMWFVEHLAGVVNAHLFLADCPDEVQALFDAMQRKNVRRAELLADRHPADMFYMVENTSTSLISPTQFRKYCMPTLRECTEIVNARGRLMVYHMCGLLKDLLGDIATLGAAGVEAFTAPTLGNTTLLDGRTACPDLCFVGGTQATFWTKPAEDIIAKVDEALAPLPHHRGLVITSAGVMPPMCEPETIRTVCDWVKTYPAKM
ncbi:MAG TPA: uroporphyrinogen decarboxylase family protein [Planctomycetota bacterium]|nr:uroporphyrinogen decarboxylase family protein [Planctomycetota bacterium]